MTTLDYRRNAAECIELSRNALFEEDAERLRAMAAAWAKLAGAPIASPTASGEACEASPITLTGEDIAIHDIAGETGARFCHLSPAVRRMLH